MQNINSNDIRDKLYFSFHIDIEQGGALTLYTPNGSYNLSVAAAEDLKVNFDINLETLQEYVNR